MSVPGEDYVLRLQQNIPSLRPLHVSVHDFTIASGDEAVALVDWEFGGVPGVAERSGFSVMRVDATGTLRWQLADVFCGPSGPVDSCGHWQLTHGAITNSGDDAYLVAGTIENLDTGQVRMIAMGISEPGKLSWIREYETPFGVGRAIGIVPLEKSDQFLVGARNFDETETWLFGIDGNGSLTGLEMRFQNRFIQRLRRLPKQGVFALGTNIDDPMHPTGWILNLDASAGWSWERNYDLGPGMPLRWYDIAEANTVLTVIGNIAIGSQEVGPVIATLQNTGADIGTVNTAQRPDGGVLIRLHGVANIQTAPDDPTDISVTSICGDIGGMPWHFAIDDSFTFFWQKKYGKTATGSLTPIAIPNKTAVIVGGYTASPGKTPEGLLVQSQLMGGGAFMCGQETNAEFEELTLGSETVKTESETLSLSAEDWWVNDGTLLDPLLSCPD